MLLGAAGWAAVTAIAPAAPALGPAVVVAAHDLTLGEPVTAADVTVAHVPADAVPDGALTSVDQARGVAAGPVRRGEVLTDVRLNPAAALRGLDDDLVLAYVPVGEGGLVAVLTAGSRVDVLSTTDGSVLAADVVVISPAPASPSAGATTYLAEQAPAGIFVAVSPEQAGRLATSSAPDLPGAGVTVVVRAPSG